MWYYDDQVFDELEEAVENATNQEEQTPDGFPLRIHRAKPYHVRSLSAQALAKEVADALRPRHSGSLAIRRNTPKDLMDYLVENFVYEFQDFDDWKPKPDRQRLLWSIRLFCLVNRPLYRLMRSLRWMQPMRPNSWFSLRQHSLGLGLLQQEIARWEVQQNGEGLLWTEDESNWEDISWEDYQAMFPELFEEQDAWIGEEFYV